MASFVGAIDSFNPYVQQIPTEAYTKVGMYKESLYAEGVRKVQDSVDQVAGLDIANEGGRTYLKNRVTELTNTLNRYQGATDFSISSNVNQLASLAAPLAMDENIINDVFATRTYRNWDKTSREKLQKGDMDEIQYFYEKQDAQKWLNSKAAGTPYSGRSVPNDATYEKITKQFIDFKAKLKPDTRYHEGDAFIYGEKTYRTSELKEFFYNNVLDGNSKEMLMHNAMYNDSGRYNLDINSPKRDLSRIYENKRNKDAESLRLTEVAITALADNPAQADKLATYKKDAEVLRENIRLYQRDIDNIKQLDPSNPSQKVGIYTALSAAYYKDSLESLFEYEQTEPKYRDDVKAAREHKNSQITSSITKGTIVGSIDPATGQYTLAGVFDEDGKPTILEKQSDLIQTVNPDGTVTTTKRASSSKSPKSTAGQLLEGTPGETAVFNIAGEGDKVSVTRQGIADVFNSQDEVIKSHVINMTDLLSKYSSNGFNVRDYYTIQTKAGGDGKDHDTIVWTSQAKQKEFMKIVNQLNSAYQIEKADGDLANGSYQAFVTGQLKQPLAALGLDKVDDNIIKEVMGTKGNNALISMLDSVFKSKETLNDLVGIDNAIARKQMVVSPWRKVLWESAATDDERKMIENMSDEDIVNDKVISNEGEGLNSLMGLPIYSKTKKSIGGLDRKTVERADERLAKVYSVIRQNLSRSVSLLNEKENEQDLLAVTQAIKSSLINQGGTDILTDPNVITGLPPGAKLTDVKEIFGATTKSEGDFFNNLGKVNITVEYEDEEGKKHTTPAQYNMSRLIAADPGFSSKFSKYFANLKYADEGAAIRLQSYVDPIKGHATYSREGYNKRQNSDGSFSQDPSGGLGKDFSSHVGNTSDAKKIPFSYKIVSFGGAAATGNRLSGAKPEDKVDNNSYAIMMQINTPSGPQNVFVKNSTGSNVQYATPEEALYMLKDQLFNTMPMDNKNQEIKGVDADGKPTSFINYYAEFDPKAPSARGFLNTQLKLNGVNIPNMEEIKKAYVDLLSGKATEIDKKLLQYAPMY